MKKITTFTSIFICVVLLMSVVRVISTDKINAKKSIRFLLRDFMNSDNVEVRILQYKNGEQFKEMNLEDPSLFLEMFYEILTRHVSSSESLENCKSAYLDYVRIELNNKTIACTIDFPVEEHAYEKAIFKYTNYRGGGIFYLTQNGSEKMKFWFE